jgi:hypothetical protein
VIETLRHRLREAKMIRVACALTTLCLLCWVAAAKEAKLGAVALTLPAPAGTAN